MFCKSCGKELPDGSAFCSGCGAKLAEGEPIRTAPVSPAPADVQPGSAETTSERPKSALAKLILVLALIAFFFPFVTVSCTNGTGETLADSSETYNGIELITTIGSKDDKLIARVGSEEKAKSNIFAAIAFLCTAASLGLLFTKTRRIVSAVLSAAAAFLLLIMRIGFRPYYDLNNPQIKEYITVDSRFGLLFCIVFLLAAAVFCYLEDPVQIQKKRSE